MTPGLSSAVANAMLNALDDAGTWTAPTEVWIKLHTGDPGAAGTSNAASNTTRKQTAFGSAAAGSATTTTDLTWTSVSATESYSHISAWDSSSGGNFLWSDALDTTRGVTAGDTFTIATGDIDMSLGTVAA